VKSVAGIEEYFELLGFFLDVSFLSEIFSRFLLRSGFILTCLPDLRCIDLKSLLSCENRSPTQFKNVRVCLNQAQAWWLRVFLLPLGFFHHFLYTAVDLQESLNVWKRV
jgi:hypothetical protein